METKQKIWLLTNIIALSVSIIWFLNDESKFEPIIVGVTAMASIVAQFFSNKKDKESGAMNIKSGKKSKNYQSSGDINIHNER